MIKRAKQRCAIPLSKTTDTLTKTVGEGIKRGWPLENEGFIIKEKPVINSLTAMCFMLPKVLFNNGAEGFYDYNEDVFTNRFHIALFQLLLFTISTVCIRVTKNTYEKSVYPLRIFLESLMNDQGKPTGDIRLWIFENATNTEYPFDSTFRLAMMSDKTVDEHGSFLKKEGNMTSNDKKNTKKATGMFVAPQFSGSASPLDRSKGYVQYKAIDSKEAMACAVDCYYMQLKYSNDANCKLSGSSDLFPTKLFDPTHTFFRFQDCTACVGQKDITNYRKTTFANGDTQWELPFYKNTFEISFMTFVGKSMNPVEFFMTRVFPHTQVNPLHMMFDKVTAKLASKNDRLAYKNMIKSQQEVMTQMLRTAHTGSIDAATMLQMREILQINVDGIEEDDDDDDEANDVRHSTEDEDGFHRINHFESDEEDVVGLSKIDLLFKESQRVTQDMARGWAEACNIATKKGIKEHTRLNDYVTHLEDYYMINDKVLTEAFPDEKDRHTKNLCSETLRNVIFERFATGCMNETSHVSETQQMLNKLFKDEDMANVHYKVNIVDPNKTLIENQLIAMTYGFGYHEDISVLQMTCVFMYLCGMDCFRRDLDLHLNNILAGGNGVGKSHAMERVIENLYKPTVTMMNSQSNMADAVNGNTSDQLIYSDDANMASEFDDPAKSANSKSRFTTMTNTRGVLEFMKKEDGSSERVFNLYINIAVKCVWLGTNETEADVMRHSQGFKESVRALSNRFITTEVASYDNEHRSTNDSMAAEKAKSEKQLRERAEWRRYNQKYRVICAWAWKLISIKVMKIDMRIFDITWKKFLENMDRRHLKPKHPRVGIQAATWCMHLVLYDAYLRLHCTETALFYKKPFVITQLIHWDAICFEHHAIIAISFFYNSFIPAAMDPVLTCMKIAMNEAFASNSDMVVFQGQQDAKKLNDDRKKITKTIDMLKRTQNMGTEHLTAVLAEASAAVVPTGRGKNVSFADAGGLNIRMTPAGHNPFVKSAAPTVAATPAVPANPVGMEDDDMPTINADYVVFKYSQSQLVRVLMGFMDEIKIKPSDAIVSGIISRLMSMTIKSHHYVLHSVDQKIPTKDTSMPLSSKLAMLDIRPQNHVAVLTELLYGESYYKDLLSTCLQEINHKYTVERDILIALPFDKIPWLFQTVHMKPVQRPLVIANSSYVNPTTSRAVYGQTGQQVLEAHQKSMFINIDSDVDTLGLLSYYASAVDNGTVNGNLIFANHPRVQQDQIRYVYDLERALAIAENPELRDDEEISYPKSFCEDLDAERELKLQWREENGCIDDATKLLRKNNKLSAEIAARISKLKDIRDVSQSVIKTVLNPAQDVHAERVKMENIEAGMAMITSERTKQVSKRMIRSMNREQLDNAMFEHTQRITESKSKIHVYHSPDGLNMDMIIGTMKKSMTAKELDEEIRYNIEVDMLNDASLRRMNEDKQEQEIRQMREERENATKIAQMRVSKQVNKEKDRKRKKPKNFIYGRPAIDADDDDDDDENVDVYEKRLFDDMAEETANARKKMKSAFDPVEHEIDIDDCSDPENDPFAEVFAERRKRKKEEAEAKKRAQNEAQ